ncbi:MAG TPA: acyltransferase [Alphaproteobacteria bacterium]|nr:acyltransferase [Alphaproteobacteria bacterium]
MLKLFLWWLWPVRWGRAFLWALCGVHVSPSALLLGRAGSFKIGCGSKIGARTRFITGDKGTLVAGAGVWMSSDIEIQTDSTVRIGDRTSIQRRCSFNNAVRIGRDCLLAPNVFISSGVHAFHIAPHLPIREQERLIEANPELARGLDRPVWIQDDCWIGINVFIGPGVTIGKGSVIGANACVVRDIEPFAIAVGVPARVVKRRLDWKPGPLIDSNDDFHRPYILSGEWQTAGPEGPAMIVVTPDEPLIAALAPADEAGKPQGVVIRYQASEDIRVEVGGEPFVLPARQNETAFPSRLLAFRYGAWLMELKIAAASPCAGVLGISRIAWARP